MEDPGNVITREDPLTIEDEDLLRLPEEEPSDELGGISAENHEKPEPVRSECRYDLRRNPKPRIK